MSNSREDSPDWLRCFQAPTHAVALLSDSESSQSDITLREDKIKKEKPTSHITSYFPPKDKNQERILCDSDAQSPLKKASKAKSLKKGTKVEDHVPVEKKKKNSHNKREGDENDGIAVKEETSEMHSEHQALDPSVWTLSSDSEHSPVNSPNGVDYIHREESPAHKTSQEKLLKVDDRVPMKGKKRMSNMIRKANDGDVEIVEGETSGKQGCSSRLPLVLSEKVHRSKVLVECEGDSIDMSGDVGAVGRVMIADTLSENHDMFLDLKGTIYKTTIVPSRTFCVVNFGQSEAKIEAIMNDFVQLKPQSNVYESETMVEGTLDGYLFDSEDEADKVPKPQTDQNEGTEEQTNRKSKGKAEKASGVVRKRGKNAGGKPKPAKKVRKKAPVSKKGKTKK